MTSDYIKAKEEAQEVVEAFAGRIRQWKVIDETEDLPAACTDEAGFLRLPFTVEAVRENCFELDKNELERLGKLKSALGMWPGEGVIHFYSPSALILGKLDRRLPAFEKAVAWLEEESVPTVLRIAGGQAIVSDRDVLNLSLLFSLPDDRFSIDDGFRLIAEVIRLAWCLYVKEELGDMPPELAMKIGEIKASYCPGDYDLSIKGKKVAGIAQRRVKNAIGVMAYISVGGDQAARCKLVRDFYEKGEADDRFPASDEVSMTCLKDSLSGYGDLAESLSAARLKTCVLSVLGAHERK